MTDLVAAWLDDIADKINRKRSEVLDARREQITTDDIDDIAQEVAYAVEHDPRDVIRTQEDVEAMLASMGLNDPTDTEQFVASQAYIWAYGRPSTSWKTRRNATSWRRTWKNRRV